MMDFQKVYDAIMGYEENATIDNEFDNGICADLYEKAFELRVRICEKLDKNDYGESPKVLQMIELYERMQEILCKKCYEYGYREGLKKTKS